MRLFCDANINADFDDIRLFPVGTHAGIIRLRLAEQAADALHPVLVSILDQLLDRDLSGKLVTASKNAIRIRGLT